VLIAGFLHPPKHFLGVDSNNGDLLMNICATILGITILTGIFVPIWTAITLSVWYMTYSIGFILVMVGGFYIYLKISMEIAWRGALKYEAEHGLKTLSKK
jgi:hypothetical protein